MITKELIKSEIDHLQEEHLEMLYKVIKAFEMPLIAFERGILPLQAEEQEEWEAFIDRYAGCLRDAPIARGDQGVYEIREELR